MSGSQHRLKRLVAQACLMDPESSGEKSTYPSGGTLGESLSWHGRGEGPMSPASQPAHQGPRPEKEAILVLQSRPAASCPTPVGSVDATRGRSSQSQPARMPNP